MELYQLSFFTSYTHTSTICKTGKSANQYIPKDSRMKKIISPSISSGQYNCYFYHLYMPSKKRTVSVVLTCTRPTNSVLKTASGTEVSRKCSASFGKTQMTSMLAACESGSPWEDPLLSPRRPPLPVNTSC